MSSIPPRSINFACLYASTSPTGRRKRDTCGVEQARTYKRKRRNGIGIVNIFGAIRRSRKGGSVSLAYKLAGSRINNSRIATCAVSRNEDAQQRWRWRWRRWARRRKRRRRRRRCDWSMKNVVMKIGRFYADKRLLRRSDSEDFERISASIDLARKR